MFASAWAAARGTVTTIVSRDPARAAALAASCGARPSTDLAGLRDAEVVVVAVPDRAVADVGAAIARALAASPASPASTVPLVLHTSGALEGAELLRTAGAARFPAGSLHPLQSFPAGAAVSHEVLAARVAGTHWFHEGDGEAEARAMVALWRGAFHRLAPGGKPLYHAGAAILSNHTVALFADATRLFAAAGVPAAEAHPALAELLAGTAANLASVGVPAALTGPIARGDAGTVRRHVAALRSAVPELIPAYRELATHHETIASTTLRDLFARDPARGDRLAYQAEGLYLDVSKHRATDETFELLVRLARDSGLRERIDAMFAGEHINVSEDRAVLHVALRAPRDAVAAERTLERRRSRRDVGVLRVVNEVGVLDERVGVLLRAVEPPREEILEKDHRPQLDPQAKAGARVIREARVTVRSALEGGVEVGDDADALARPLGAARIGRRTGRPHHERGRVARRRGPAST